MSRSCADMSELQFFWQGIPRNGAFHKLVRKHHWSPQLLSGLDRQRLGRLGESIVERWAQAIGLEIIAKGFRNRGFELDVVTRINSEMHVIEVKTRLDPRYEPNFDVASRWLNIRKKEALKRGAQFILQQMDMSARSLHAICFDLVVVDIRKLEQSLSVYRWPNVTA